jgi:uncharacterized protein (TIGR02300 family)
MDKNDWGVKRVCLSCAARFYDFDKSPIVCPSCGATFDPEYLIKRKTKTVQEKNEDVIEDIDVADDDDLIDAEDDLDDAEDEVALEDAKN